MSIEISSSDNLHLPFELYSWAMQSGPDFIKIILRNKKVNFLTKRYHEIQIRNGILDVFPEATYIRVTILKTKTK